MSTTLQEGDELIEDDNLIATLFNDYFANITKSLNIEQWKHPNDIDETYDEVTNILLKYENHPSVLKIKQTVDQNHFQFTPVSEDDVEEVIKNLKPEEKCPWQYPNKTCKTCKFYHYTLVDKICECYDNQWNFSLESEAS